VLDSPGRRDRFDARDRRRIGAFGFCGARRAARHCRRRRCHCRHCCTRGSDERQCRRGLPLIKGRTGRYDDAAWPVDADHHLGSCCWHSMPVSAGRLPGWGSVSAASRSSVPGPRSTRDGRTRSARPNLSCSGKPARAADENPLISCFAPLRDALAIGKLRVRHRVESSDCGIAVSAPYRRTSPCSMRLFRSSSRTHRGLSLPDSPTEALEKTRV